MLANNLTPLLHQDVEARSTLLFPALAGQGRYEHLVLFVFLLIELGRIYGTRSYLLFKHW